MSFFRILFVILYSALLTSSSYAIEQKTISELEERIAQQAKLSDFLDYAWQESNRIKAARTQVQETLTRFDVVTGYPDPSLTLTYLPKSLPDDLETKRVEIMISQALPFPGKLKAGGDVNRSDTQLAQLALDRENRDLTIAIQESYHELLYLRAAREISLKSQELANRIKAAAEAEYARNQLALTEIIRAQSLLSQLQYDYLKLEELERLETVRLNVLLNRSVPSPIGSLETLPVVPIVYQLEQLHELALQNLIELQIAKTEIEKSTTELELVRYENYPEFMLGVFYESTLAEEPESGREEMWGLQLGMTLPIWQAKKTGRTTAAGLAIDKNKELLITQTHEIKSRVQEYYFALKDAERLILLHTNELIPRTKQSITLAQSWYEQRLGSQAQYLDFQMLLLNSQLAIARATADYNRSLARLEGIIGKRLTDSTKF